MPLAFGWIFDQSAPGEIVPISRQRVIAHIHNPYAEAEDIVLLVAVRAGRCIGYHGLLPGLLKHDGGLSKIYWATTFYVSEAFRGQAFGKLMIEKIKALHIDFIVTGMTRAAEKAYLSCGLKVLGPIVFYQLRIDKLLRFKFFYHGLKHLLYRLWLNSQSQALQKFGYTPVDQIKATFKSHSTYPRDARMFTILDPQPVPWPAVLIASHWITATATPPLPKVPGKRK